MINKGPSKNYKTIGKYDLKTPIVIQGSESHIPFSD